MLIFLFLKATFSKFLNFFFFLKKVRKTTPSEEVHTQVKYLCALPDYHLTPRDYRSPPRGKAHPNTNKEHQTRPTALSSRHLRAAKRTTLHTPLCNGTNRAFPLAGTQLQHRFPAGGKHDNKGKQDKGEQGVKITKEPGLQPCRLPY